MPSSDAVVKVPKDSLKSIFVDLNPETEKARISYVAAAAKVADALENSSSREEGHVLLAPMDSKVIPLPHQIHALSRAVSNDRVRYLLADEVGLGKTIEAGLILRELKLRGLVRRTLVVSPKGIATQWVSEMQAHFNEKFQMILGEDLKTLHRISATPWTLFDQVIVSLDSVKPMDKRQGWSKEKIDTYNQTRFEDLVTAGWDLIIVDESHRLGGSTDQVARYKLGKGLSEAAPYLLLLSATPHQGKTDAFHRLISLLDETAFPDMESVTKERVSPFVIRTEKQRALDATGKPLFKPRLTQMSPVCWETRHHLQKLLYEAVTDYVRAINFVFQDSVEFRVREVLEEKLSIIFKEFGIDKTGDVLDSAQAGEIFEEIFTSAILNPDEIEQSVDHSLARIKHEMDVIQEESAVYSISDELDIHAAQRLRSHPLPHWIERMITSYLKTQGGKSIRKRFWWELHWPDKTVDKKVVFNSKDALKYAGTNLLNLENPKVKGLTLQIPQMAKSQPIPRVNISNLPNDLKGYWGLFEIRISSQIGIQDSQLRTPTMRRGFLSVFSTEEGKVYLPTARHIWDTMTDTEPLFHGILSIEESIEAFEWLQTVAEDAGKDLFNTLQQNHMEALSKEKERGDYFFESRKKSIELVGLPEVKQYRLNKLLEDKTAWQKDLKMAALIIPEIRPLLLLKIEQGETHE